MRRVSEREEMSERTPLVSIVIPHYQTEMLARLCLRSIRRYTRDREGYETIVVDNNSGDGSLSYLRSVAWIRLIERPEVVDGGAGGEPHGEAMDIGMAAARGEYILSLHTDTIVLTEGWLAFLVGKIEGDERTAAVGSYKLEKTSGGKRALKRLTDVHALKQWVKKRVLGRNIKEERRYIRTHCALYRLGILRELGLSFRAREQLTSGEETYLRLNEEGYGTLLLDSAELMHYMVHVSHGTRAHNPRERTRAGTPRKGKRRLERLLADPKVAAILGDDSIDR